MVVGRRGAASESEADMSKVSITIEVDPHDMAAALRVLRTRWDGLRLTLDNTAGRPSTRAMAGVEMDQIGNVIDAIVGTGEF